MIVGAPALPLAAPAGDGGGSIAALLLVLVAVLVATTLLGDLAQRLGQPAVLGEIIAGVLLGGSALGILDAREPVVRALSAIGVIVLLFETGLHTELRALLRVGSTAATVGLAGVAIPFALGYASAIAFGIGPVPALVCGAALCATSVGISSRVLADLGQLETTEGRVVLGAAVLDDVVGLVILSVVAAVVNGAEVTAGHVARVAGIAIAFVLGAVLAGLRVMPPAFRIASRLRSQGALGLLGLAFAFALAWAAERSGSAMIVGAFAAGVVLNAVPERREIERATTTIGRVFVPIFFASVGAAVDLRALADPRALAVGVALIVCGIAGKLAAAYVPVWFRGRKLVVGVAMVPRGEVGLIFAQMGLTTGAIDHGLFGALMLMVLVTTLVVPPALGRIARRAPVGLAVSSPDLPGEGGIDDLVAGTRERR